MHDVCEDGGEGGCNNGDGVGGCEGASGEEGRGDGCLLS